MNKTQKFITSLAIVGLLIIIGLIVTLASQLRPNHHQSELKAEIAALQIQNADLNAQLAKHYDAGYLEAIWDVFFHRPKYYIEQNDYGEIKLWQQQDVSAELQSLAKELMDEGLAPPKELPVE